jgi:putative sterol carrier protein
MASSTGAGNPTEEFFRALAARRHEPLLQNASGTLRFDLADGGGTEHWFVAIEKGDVTVSHKRGKADAVIRVDRTFLDRILTGRENAMAAALRGVLVPEGDLGLLMLFQRLFPGPPGARGGPGTAPIPRGAR